MWNRECKAKPPCGFSFGISKNSAKFLTGFTLVESMVAITILLTAIVGSVSLVARGIFDFKFAKNKLVAMNLAQEGIELVRVIKENNVLCDSLNGNPPHQWDKKPGGGNLDGHDYAVDSNAIPIDIDCTPPGGSDIKIQTPSLTGSCNSPLLFDPANGRYSYVSGNPTMFSRCIHICTPPSSGKVCGSAPDTGDTPVIPPSDQMDIVSVVQWKEGGNDRSVTARERVYDWR